MGSDRKWILLAFISATLLAAWIVNQAVELGLSGFRIQNPLLLGVISTSMVGSLLVIGGIAFAYFRQEKVNVFSTEVLQELHKVTWPQRKMAMGATGVVIVLTVIISAVLGVFDWMCARVISFVIGV